MFLILRLAEALKPLQGEIIVVDKPLGWSSFHVVKKLRGALTSRLRKAGVRKLKVGHAGTLDPLASGVMIVCTGKATKEIERLQSGVKEYIADIRLGATTPSFDRETPVDATFPTEHITREAVENALKGFIGRIEQIPPDYSACKVDGHRAYKMARKGETVELKPKVIVIDSIEILDFKDTLLVLRIVCSKGTYIRSVARDIGVALHTGAYLENLRRTQVGEARIEDALSIPKAVGILLSAPCTVEDDNGNEIVVEPMAVPQDFMLNEKADIKPFDER